MYTYKDIYTMDSDYFESKEEIIDYIKNDLKLVSGGGYNSKHIHNIKFNIKRV